MNNVNLELKAELIRQFGSCVSAAPQLRMTPSRLSLLIHRHIKPTQEERHAISRVLGRETAQRVLD